MHGGACQNGAQLVSQTASSWQMRSACGLLIEIIVAAAASLNPNCASEARLATKCKVIVGNQAQLPSHMHTRNAFYTCVLLTESA